MRVEVRKSNSGKKADGQLLSRRVLIFLKGGVQAVKDGSFWYWY